MYKQTEPESIVRLILTIDTRYFICASAAELGSLEAKFTIGKILVGKDDDRLWPEDYEPGCEYLEFCLDLEARKEVSSPRPPSSLLFPSLPLFVSACPLPSLSLLSL